ncbi:hypothetical protein [Gracilibacillus sp. YIM 98692]|uniref:hypothetical protein n=1 Tax=Gracilibacillus sp. YIM 98692 TaxID=2663532 RepID=UPI0013D68A2C|nr:hypothetical protein [Gracilibacillus sp. YIM 98692]
MVKRYFKQILFLIILIAVLVFGVKQYHEKKMYEEYISHVITNNSQELIEGIVQTNTIYDESLDNNELTSQQLKLLSMYSTDILQDFQYNLGLAQQFSLYAGDGDTEKIKEDLQEIDQFYNHLLNNELKTRESEGMVYELDPTLKEKLTHINELNKLWLDSIYTDIEEVSKHGDEFVFNTRQFQEKHGNNTISSRIWIDILIELSEIHKDYLNNNELFSISEVLN